MRNNNNRDWNCEIITGHGETFLDSSIIPEKIASIYFDTKTRFAVFLNAARANWASVLLDFTSPSPLSWVPFPSASTPNNSGYTVSAQNEAWGSALNTRLDKFLTERRTRRDWLHKQATYDVLMFVFAIPFILWVEARLGGLLIEGRQLPSIISIGIYVWLFFALSNVVRLIFSYARWAFPKLEFASERSSVATHQAILVAILIGIVGSALWDAVKSLW